MRKRTSIAIAFCALLLAVLAGPSAAAEITNSSEDLRTGWYPNESVITPELVSSGTFGQEWSANIEGQAYAQPLLDGDTLLVATEHNVAYGLNPESGATRWKTVLQGTPWNPGEISCADLTPEIGVTSTPVIDTATNTAYLTHKAYKSGSSGEVVYYMDALSMETGEERPGFPVEIQGSAQNDSEKTFFARDQLQRPGLLLMDGIVFAGFGSDCDYDPFQGWVFGVGAYGESYSHDIISRWTSETNDSGSGIWQSGSGLASDGDGTILLSTGNGSSPKPGTPGDDPPGTLGQSIVRLRLQENGELKATDFFAPEDAEELANWDADFASGGVTGLPNAYFGTSSIPHLLVAVGKDGYVYLLNRDNLGGIAAEGEPERVVQRLGPYGGVWSRPGVWPGEGGWIYIPTASDGETAGGSSGNLRVYKYGLSPSGSPALSLAATSSEAFGFSSSAPVITSNGTVSGSALVWLVWAPNGTGEGAQLRAYDPVPVEVEPGRFEPHIRWSAPIGTSAKFAMPGVGGGRIFVGTRDGHVLAFGSPVTPSLTGPPTEFPTTIVGEESDAKAVLTAHESLEITSLEASPGEFEVGTPSPALPAHLTNGGKIEVPVAFVPTGTGPQAGTLTATTSTGKRIPFSLHGTGQEANPKLQLAPKVVSFGGTTVGTIVPGAATLTNVGAGALKITKILALHGPFSADVEGLQGRTVASGESLTIPLEFQPTSFGEFREELVVESTGGEGRIALTGSAAVPGHLQISPEANPFGQVTVGGSATKTFVVSNTGGVLINVYKSKPPVGGEFEATSPLPEGTSLSPGESISLTVRFSPTAAGAAQGVWLINGEGSTFVHEVTFTGEGVLPASSSPTTLTTSTTPDLSVSPFTAVALPEAELGSASAMVSRTGSLSVPVSCPKGVTACVGTVVLHTIGLVRVPDSRHAEILTLASASFSIAGGHVLLVRLHLSHAARELLARHHSLKVHAIVAAHDAAGHRHTATETFTLKLGARGHG